MPDTNFTPGTIVEASWLNDVNDGLYGPYPAGTLGADLASTAGDALIGVLSPATGAVATTQHEVNERTRSLADFMTAAQRADCLSGAATIDCSAAVSTAVQWCIDNGVKILENPYKKVRLTASAIIDRQVDGAAFDSYFTIRGGGFYVTSAVNMFSSSIAFTTAAVSQLVKFENVTFEASGTGYDAYVLHDARFLRLWFSGCDFVKIKCLYAPTVLTQSYYFDNCNMRRWTGIFWRSLNVNFDHKWHHCIAEAGDQFARMAFPVGCSYHQNVIEGMSGTAIRAWGSQGLSYKGNYMEQNDCDLDLRTNGGEASYGVSVLGNMFSHSPSGSYAPSSTYSIRWDTVFNSQSEGNYFTTYGHELGTQTQVRIDDFAVTSISNAAGTQYRPAYNAPAVSAYASGDQAITTSVFTKITFDVETYDTNANFASSRFTPTVPGLYSVGGNVRVSGTNITRVATALYKNGTEVARLSDEVLGSVALHTVSVTDDLSMNGSTDYVELWVYVVATSPVVDSAGTVDTSRFRAHYIRNIN